MLTTEEITKIRIDTGVAPIPVQTNTVSLSDKLGIAKPQESNYFQRVGQQYNQAGQDVISAVRSGAEAIQNPNDKLNLENLLKPTRTALRTVGAVAGAAFAPILEAPIIKPLIEKTISKVVENPHIKNILTEATALAEKYPEFAKDAKNIVDILTLGGGKAVEAPLGKTVKSATGEVLSKTGTIIKASGERSLATKTENFVLDLVKPVRTDAVKLEEVARTSEKGVGPFKTSVIKPTIQEARSALEVAKIPGISKSKTYQQNYNIIRDANVVKAQQLEAELEANNFIFPKKELLSRLNKTKTILAENPSIVGDSAKTADKLVAQFEKILNETKADGASLLKARKDFDALVESQKGAKVFDPKTENAFTIALREIRTTVNDFLDEKASKANIPTAVKKSLKEQRAIYDAMDNVAQKAKDEADTAIGRAFNNMMEAVGIKNKIVQQVAALAGIGGLGAAATFAPAAIAIGGTGWVLYQGGKLIANPKIRVLIGELLQKSGKLLNPADKTILEDFYKGNIEGKIGLSIEDVNKKIPSGNKQEVAETNLTTKFLEYAKGKTTLSKQEILDFAKRPELKKGEADLLNKIGNQLPEGKLPVQDFADSIRGDLLELKPVRVAQPQYQRTTVGGYETKYDPQLKTNKLMETGNKNYEEVVFESPITTSGSSHYPNSKNYFAHARGDEVVEGGKKIWREQEIQSDLLQKEGLEQAKRQTISYEGRIKELEKETGSMTKAIEQAKLERNQEIDTKLSPFTNDRFGERIMRERIKEKAQAGYSKYRLPTGETIGKIEGFQEPRWLYEGGGAEKLSTEKLKIGLEIRNGGQDSQNWIITDILGDGRFKAVQKRIYEQLKGLTNKDFGKNASDDFVKGQIDSQIQASSETFDLTGKSNPQYRRYENWGKFLKNKYGGKEVTDPQGNSWMEIDLNKDMGRLPIEAFGITPLLVDDEE